MTAGVVQWPGVGSNVPNEDPHPGCGVRRPGARRPSCPANSERPTRFLIDKAEGFVFGSRNSTSVGRTTPSAVFHPYRDIDKAGVTFVRATVTSMDPVAKRVEIDVGPFESDVLVVALGADVDPTATPGLVEGGSEFYSLAGAFACATYSPRSPAETS